MSKAVVVTGGAGFIGSCVIRTLNQLGITKIYIVDDLESTDKWKNLIGKQFVEIIAIKNFFSWLKGREEEILAIIHLGACSSTVESDGNFLLENNTNYSIRIAEIALKHEIQMIYASSAATYGDGSHGFSDEHTLLESLKPLNLYGFSKHMFDLWAYRTGALKDLIGLKYFNVFGPNEWHKGRMASAVWHIYPQAKNKGEISLFESNEKDKFNNGEQCRDFIYVKDAARMTCAFLGKPYGGIYNIGRGEPGTWNEVATAVFEALDKPVCIKYVPMPTDLNGKYQNYTCATMEKTKKILGNEANCAPLHETVVDYVKEHLIPERRW
jgi:ADP-L-glycero-D-manno-heptose 6-epimerase